MGMGYVEGQCTSVEIFEHPTDDQRTISQVVTQLADDEDQDYHGFIVTSEYSEGIFEYDMFGYAQSQVAIINTSDNGQAMVLMGCSHNKWAKVVAVLSTDPADTGAVDDVLDEIEAQTGMELREGKDY